MVRAYLLAASICAGSTTAFTGLSANAGEPIRNLAGRWAGNGTVIPASGPSERFKCVFSYFPSDGGGRV